MPAPTTAIYLNSTTPAAPSGNQNVKPQSDGESPQQSITFYPQAATADLLGVVKPDGSTITIDDTGTISAAGGGGGLLSGSAPPVTPAFVQAATGGGDSLAFTSDVTSGDLLVVAFKSESAIGSITISDTLGTSYALATSITGEANNIALYYGLAPSSGANTVTVGSAPGNYDRLAVAEFSGVNATVDATATIWNGGGTNPESLSITTTDPGDLIVLAAAGYHNADTFAFSGGFTLDSQSGGGDANAIGHQIAGAAGSYTASVNITGAGADNSALILVAFTSAAPGADGDFYLDTTNGVLYGPRTDGAYGAVATGVVPTGAEGLVLATPAGASGAASLRALVASDLPVATDSAPGAVQPDGSTITISDGIISATSGGGGGGGGVAVTTPVIRGSALSSTTGSDSSFTVSIPTGAQPGDMAVLFYGGGWTPTNPSGWQVLYNSNGDANINSGAWWKLLTTADIVAGSVTVTTAGAYDGNLAIIVLEGQTAGIRTVVDAVDTGSTASPQSLTTPATLMSTDLVLSFGALRAATSVTCNVGTQIQQANDGANASAVLNAGPALVNGSLTSTFSWSADTTGPFAGIVVVIVGVPTIASGLWSGLIAAPSLSSPLDLSNNMNQQSSFSASAETAGISLVDLTGKGSDFVEGVLDVYPTAPFTLTWLSTAYSAGSFNNAGLIVASSLTGAVMMFGYRYGSGGPWEPWVLTYSTPNSSPSTAATPNLSVNGLCWFQYKDDGTNITFSVSFDSIFWIQMYTVSKASSFLGSDDFAYIGFGLEAYSGAQMSILSLTKS